MIKIVDYPSKQIIQHSYNEFIDLCHEEEGWELEELGVCSDNEKIVHGMWYGDKEDLETKPVIFITVTHHGNEWETAYYAKEFRHIWHNPKMHPNYQVIEKLKQTFSVYCIPIVNPYGFQLHYDNFDTDQGRLNANGVDINRDYLNESQPETLIVKNKFKELSPVAIIDCHSFRTTEALGYGDVETPFYRELYWRALDNLAAIIKPYAANKDSNLTSLIRGHIPHYNDTTYNVGQGRAWASNQTNKYGLGVLSFLIESHRFGPSEREMYFGVNSLIVLFYHTYIWWTERKTHVGWRDKI